MKPSFVLYVRLVYSYGGDTGPCTLVEKDIGPIDHAELLKAIDALGDELRAKAKGT